MPRQLAGPPFSLAPQPLTRGLCVKQLMIPRSTSRGALVCRDPLRGSCVMGVSWTPMWSPGSDIPGLARPLVPCGVLTWSREMGTHERGAFDLKKAGALAKSPRRPCLAQAQASLSEGGPFQRHLGNTFDKWLRAGAGRADPAPGLLLGSPPQVPGHRTIWRVRMCARPHIPAWRP